MNFYDVKTKQSVEAEIVDKTEYVSNGRISYAVKGQTADGRPLTRFVSKKDYDAIDVCC